MSQASHITAKIKAHAKEVALLQKQLAKLQTKLLKLPAKHGFASMAEFIAALEEAAGKTGAAAKPGKARTRAKITPETKEQVKEQVKAGKTGAQIAKALGISLPSVQNIKKELGLVKKRK